MTVAAWAAALVALAAGAEPCPVVLRPDPAGVAFVHDAGRTAAKHLPETMGPGVAFLDADGDGDLDLFTVQSGPFPPPPRAAAADRLWRNDAGADGSPRFVDATAAAGLDRGPGGYGQGVLAADLDGDGHRDLLVTRFGPDAFWRNRGDGSFVSAPEAGLATGGWSSSAAAGDADGDGDLDLYVTRYLAYDPADELFCGDLDGGRTYCDPSIFDGVADVFYRREGDRFVDATAAAGLLPEGGPGKGLGVVLVDLDGDRRPEVYVANDITPNFLFANRGGGRFEDVSLFSGAAANAAGQYEAGMGIAAGDVDGDGDADLAVTNFDVETNTLYANHGDLQFTDVAAASGFGVPSFNLLGFGVVLGDLDRDGDLDAYVANGHIFDAPRREGVERAQRDLLLLGDGRGGFVEARCPELAARRHVARGLAAGDADGDGDLDLAVGVNDGPAELLWNETAGGGWAGVVLRGRAPNTEGVGAVVDLVAAGRRQRRWVTAGDSYQSTSDRRVLFGTGEDAPTALDVAWPSGRRQRVAAPPAGRYLVVAEPAR